MNKQCCQTTRFFAIGSYTIIKLQTSPEKYRNNRFCQWRLKQKNLIQLQLLLPQGICNRLYQCLVEYFCREILPVNKFCKAILRYKSQKIWRLNVKSNLILKALINQLDVRIKQI